MSFSISNLFSTIFCFVRQLLEVPSSLVRKQNIRQKKRNGKKKGLGLLLTAMVIGRDDLIVEESLPHTLWFCNEFLGPPADFLSQANSLPEDPKMFLEYTLGAHPFEKEKNLLSEYFKRAVCTSFGKKEI